MALAIPGEQGLHFQHQQLHKQEESVELHRRQSHVLLEHPIATAGRKMHALRLALDDPELSTSPGLPRLREQHSPQGSHPTVGARQISASLSQGPPSTL